MFEWQTTGTLSIHNLTGQHYHLADLTISSMMQAALVAMQMT